MQPFRDDDAVLRARAAELEEELAGLRERLVRARRPSAERVSQLERAIQSQRRMLESTRRQPAAVMMFMNHGIVVPMMLAALFCLVLVGRC